MWSTYNGGTRQGGGDKGSSRVRWVTTHGHEASGALARGAPVATHPPAGASDAT
jgi:hypothetical protein